MIIANPIYDVIFKYLLEDIEITREFLSVILEEEIQSLELKPHESTNETWNGIFIIRFDFKALIHKKDGTKQKVLIELQKAKKVFDVMRFRRYLGDNYRKEDDLINEKGKNYKKPLPIVTIYILGFSLDNIPSAVVKINREYTDVVTKKVLDIKDDFIELLTHDSYLIQVKKLPSQARSKLESVLQIFSPEFQSNSDKHQLYFQGDFNNPLVKKMVDRLGRAVVNDPIRDMMDVEDELDRTFERQSRKLENEVTKREMMIAQLDAIMGEKDIELREKNTELKEKNTELKEKNTELKEKDSELKEKELQLIKKDSIIDENEKLLRKEQEYNISLQQENLALQRLLDEISKKND
jgi:hypothetical protein